MGARQRPTQKLFPRIDNVTRKEKRNAAAAQNHCTMMRRVTRCCHREKIARAGQRKAGAEWECRIGLQREAVRPYRGEKALGRGVWMPPFRLVHVSFAAGQIGQATDVIDVQMCEHGPKPSRGHPPDALQLGPEAFSGRDRETRDAAVQPGIEWPERIQVIRTDASSLMPASIRKSPSSCSTSQQKIGSFGVNVRLVKIRSLLAIAPPSRVNDGTFTATLPVWIAWIPCKASSGEVIKPFY